MLQHYWNAILHRIVAAATGAMQPGVRGIVWTRDELVMTYRANDNLEQSLGKNRRHLLSLDLPTPRSLHKTGPFTMGAAGRMVHG